VLVSIGVLALPLCVVVEVLANRLVGTRREAAFFFGFSASVLALIVGVAGLDGGVASPLTWLLVLPIAYQSISYPLIAVGWGVAASQAGVLALMAVAGDWSGPAWYRSMFVAVFNVLAVAASRNRHTHQVAVRRLTIKASHDDLTGCLAHGTFVDRLDAECARSRRHDRRFSLVLADVDHFKEINDSLGHQAGDERLRTVGVLLQSRARAADEVGRLGGDEFAILLVEADAAAAAGWADRVRTLLRRERDDPPMTMSMGVTTWSGPADTAHDLIQRADAALYEAKAAGRDRVVIASRSR
jgi:diguanylate cyclase (GGDEF)-like protein